MRYDVSGLSRGAELHDMLKAEIMLRRLKRDVLSQVGWQADVVARRKARNARQSLRWRKLGVQRSEESGRVYGGLRL